MYRTCHFDFCNDLTLAFRVTNVRTKQVTEVIILWNIGNAKTNWSFKIINTLEGYTNNLVV